MGYSLTHDLYTDLMQYPGDTALVTKFILAQAQAIHTSRNHAATCRGYGNPSVFEECGVRWCKAARRIAGMDEPSHNECSCCDGCCCARVRRPA